MALHSTTSLGLLPFVTVVPAVAGTKKAATATIATAVNQLLAGSDAQDITCASYAHNTSCKVNLRYSCRPKLSASSANPFMCRHCADLWTYRTQPRGLETQRYCKTCEQPGKLRSTATKLCCKAAMEHPVTVQNHFA